MGSGLRSQRQPALADRSSPLLRGAHTSRKCRLLACQTLHAATATRASLPPLAGIAYMFHARVAGHAGGTPVKATRPNGSRGAANGTTAGSGGFSLRSDRAARTSNKLRCSGTQAWQELWGLLRRNLQCGAACLEASAWAVAAVRSAA